MFIYRLSPHEVSFRLCSNGIWDLQQQQQTTTNSKPQQLQQQKCNTKYVSRFQVELVHKTIQRSVDRFLVRSAVSSGSIYILVHIYLLVILAKKVGAFQFYLISPRT